ncbi:MAG: hypothetical protein BMS9Abin08_1836 [Gammaproteobacteria bacterium]|nr:MAG: hypothetical protein BMS9Abin08_1836 [Gammaproteobacteria bacterium]
MKSLSTFSAKSCKRLAAVSAAGGLAFLWAGMVHGLAPYLYLEDPVPFYLERPTVRALFSVKQENETRTGPFTNLDTDTATTRQKLDIRTRGWVYHPALVVFDAGLRPEFRQRKEDADNDFKQDDDDTFLGYFLDTTWLKDKPYTINLFTSRDKQDTTSSATSAQAADVITETSVDRGSLMLKYPVLPTTMTVESRETITDGFFRSIDANDSLRLESRKETLNSKTTLTVESREQDRRINGVDSSTDWFTTFINNTYRPGDKSTLTSGFFYSDRSSASRDSTTTRLNSRLRINHRKNFSTHYLGRLDQRDEKDFSSDSVSLGAGLTHSLYENLTTTFNVNTTRNKLNDGDLNTDSASLDFRYRRYIPWGRVNMNLGVRERIEDDTRDGTFAQVRDEPHTFIGLSTQIFLDNKNVDNTTIIVTDSTGLTTYVEGIDYVVDAVGDSTRITRDPFAGIGNNELVLVDYSHVRDPPAKTGQTTTTFGTNLYLWDMLTLFYQRSDFKERLISGQKPNELNDDTVQRAGAELKWRWSTTYVELEDRDTTVAPWERFLVRETLTFQPTRNLSFGFGAEYSEVEVKDTGEVTEGTLVNANLTWNVGPRGVLRARAFDRRADSSVQQTVSKGFISTYDWWYGAWRPSVRYEFLDDVNDVTGDTRKRHIIYFQIERFFN